MSEDGASKAGISRRDFLKLGGIATAAVALSQYTDLSPDPVTISDETIKPNDLSNFRLDREITQLEINMSIVDNRPMESSEIPEGSNPSLRTEKKSVGLEVLGATQKDFTPYVAAAAYGMWESMQAMKPYIAPGVGMVSQELTHPRAQEGIRKLFEQNVGDGTIVALGFLGGEAVLQTIDIIGKRLGKKGINPEIRFLASLTFGVATATYLETTTIMNNTVDIPGDLFGVALGAAAILTGKVAQKHLTEENLTKLMVAGSELSRTIPEKLKAFSHKLSESLKKERPGELNPENLATEFVSIIEEKET